MIKTYLVDAPVAFGSFVGVEIVSRFRIAFTVAVLEAVSYKDSYSSKMKKASTVLLVKMYRR